jgi:2-polyprenyl-3-methyl-5-hydroxy-6-metoxy-1,4-benzoquinol methylase
MLPSPDVVRDDFDRIARHARGLPDRIEPPTHRLLAALPRGRCRVLEVGCGTGALSRKLATGGARVTAIDLSPRMIDVARVRTNDGLGIEYRVSDFMTWEPRGFDVAIAIATLHHLPLADALTRMAAAVVPGGTVLVGDLFAARGLLALPYNAISWLRRQLRPRPEPNGELTAAWAAHGEHDDMRSLREVRAIAAATLPGCSVRGHLGWRYTLVWRKPR